MNQTAITNSVDILTKLWETSNVEKKEALLEACKLDKSWAQTKTMTEMVERGGGFAAKQLHELVKAWQKVNPDTEVLFQ